MVNSIPRKRPSYVSDDDGTSDSDIQPIPTSNEVGADEPPQKRQRSNGAPSLLKQPAEQKDVASKKPKKKRNTVAAGHCSLSKKEFGDRIKASLALEKYGSQRTRIDVSHSSYIEDYHVKELFR